MSTALGRRPLSSFLLSFLLFFHNNSNDSRCSTSLLLCNAFTLKKYQYKDYGELTYRYKDAAGTTTTTKNAMQQQQQQLPTVVLIHPVGVGMSSWFWEKTMNQMVETMGYNGPIVAPNLIGCGLEDGNTSWNPNNNNKQNDGDGDDGSVQNLPLEWVKQIEYLIQYELPSSSSSSSSSNTNNDTPPCILVVQGGCAPIGIMLASRDDNRSRISKLVLASPPTYTNMVTTPVNEKELQNNYNFYTSSLGNLAFQILESKWAVKLFSNLFLFQTECDDMWVEQCTNPLAVTNEARAPVAVFNSGYLLARSYKDEIMNISQPTIIISGKGDKRTADRVQYGIDMKDCSLVTLEEGCNLVPWESPMAFCSVLIQMVCEKEEEEEQDRQQTTT